MSYMGKQLPLQGNYGTESFNGGGDTFTLSRTATAETILVFIEGVRQTPTDAYTVSGTTLTTTATTPSGTDNVTVQFLGDVVDFGEPGDDTVTSAKIVDGAIVNADVNASAAVDVSKLNISGSATSANFLRGDSSWQTAGVATLAALTDCTVSASDPATDTNPSAVGYLWVNSTSGEAYIATDVTTDSNIWTNIGDGSGQIAGYMIATGGTITTDGDYKVHTFTGDGTFTVTRVGQIGTVESLVIAGGGGAGSNEHGGGGGAGGYRNSYGSEASGGGGSSESALAVTAQAYSITVGGGGTGASGGPNANGAAGNNSVFSTITSTAGGYGAGYPNVGGNGGSGGGSGGQSGGSVSSGTSNQGYAGGGNNVHNGSGGGGGGAGAVGATTTGNYTGTGGAGGNGVASSITGASVTRGGGGGGGANTAGAGGSGGGGSDGNGTVNTGGGGGGQAGSSQDGGNGGSGTVIIRYQFQ